MCLSHLCSECGNAPRASGVQRGWRWRRQRRCGGRSVRGAAGRGGAPRPGAAAAADRGLTGCARGPTPSCLYAEARVHFALIACPSGQPCCAAKPARCLCAGWVDLHRQHADVPPMRCSCAGMLLPRRPDPGAPCTACCDLPGEAAGGTLARPLEVALVVSPGRASDPDARTGACPPGAAPTVSYQPVSGAWSVPSYAERPSAVVASTQPGCYHPQSVTPNCA